MKFVFIPVFFALLALAPFLTHAQSFVPLTSVPAFAEVASSDSLANFLNNMYKIAVGLAAVLAVLQITRAGFEYMGGDSITEKRHARHLILMSLVGLLLVLSPAIVFGIIDPRILNLDLNVEQLQPTGSSRTNSTGSVRQESSGTYSAQSQPGSFGISNARGRTTYYFNIPTEPGNRVLIFSRNDTSTQPACMALAYKTFSDEATCTEAKAGAQASHQGWTMIGECQAAPLNSNYVPIQSEDRICGEVEQIP